MRATTGRDKTLAYYMRILHRDIGFLMIGLTLVFAASGILLVYRSTDLLKSDTSVSRTLSPGLSGDDLSRALHLRKAKVSEDGQYLVFSSEPSIRDGKYDRESGAVDYTEKKLPSLLEKFNALHKTGSSAPIHWFSVVYGVLLMFLAISSFWMFKRTTRQFRRALVFASLGFVVAALLLAAV